MQPIKSERSIKVFISYAHADQELYRKLEAHLSSLVYSGKISIWQNQEISAGENWEDNNNAHLNEADLILFLVSASFIHLWSKEVEIALERHMAGTARVIPILLRPALWQDTPLGQLQFLPTGGKPVTQWNDPDAAFEDVARGIRNVAEDLQNPFRQELRYEGQGARGGLPRPPMRSTQRRGMSRKVASGLITSIIGVLFVVVAGSLWYFRVWSLFWLIIGLGVALTVIGCLISVDLGFLIKRNARTLYPPDPLSPQRGASLETSSVSGLHPEVTPLLYPPTDFNLSFPLSTGDGTVHFRIVEEPLTVQNFLIIFSALAELSTKYWLIVKNRFADLVEYTQTHSERFVQEANIMVTGITYHSPMNMDWKVDLSAPSVAEALVTTIDGITQVRKRLEQAELENQAKAQEMKRAEQQADHERQMALLEREKQALAVEQQRLEILEKRLEVQKKGIEYALEIAGRVVDTLHPGADQATRAMEIQALLPNLIQLQSGKGLELVLPVPQETQQSDGQARQFEDGGESRT